MTNKDNQEKLRIVADTNVLISSIFWRGSSYKVMRYGFEGRYELILSTKIIEELIRKLEEKFNLPEERIAKEIGILLYFCTIISPDIEISVVENDPSDNKVIEAALTANAQYIVSGDPHLKDIGKYERIKILDPGSFLNELHLL